MIHGCIHTNARIEQQMDVATQVMYAAEIISQFLNALTELGIEITYRSVFDNHSRIIADKNQHIEMFLEILSNLKDKNEIMANALASDVKALNEDQKTFLKNLPVNHEFTYLNTKILMVHGSPRKNDENIFPEMPMTEIEEMVKDTDADIILCGHTHIPCGYQTESRKTVVNDGSVGRPFSEEPKACYAILDISMGCVAVRHKHISYDVDTASKKLLSRGFDGCDKLAKMLIHATSRYPQ